MRNVEAIRVLLEAADNATDPLDATACQRAAVWLRWCDGFGAMLTVDETKRFLRSGALGEAARGLVRRLFQEFPPPPEDGSLRYLDEEEEGGQWKNRILHSVDATAQRDVRTQDPFEMAEPDPGP